MHTRRFVNVIRQRNGTAVRGMQCTEDTDPFRSIVIDRRSPSCEQLRLTPTSTSASSILPGRPQSPMLMQTPLFLAGQLHRSVHHTLGYDQCFANCNPLMLGA